MHTRMIWVAAGAASLAMSVSHAAAQPSLLMVVDSSNNRVAAFDPFDGSLVNSNYIDLPSGAATPNHAIQVGSEIWVSDQVADRIDRFSLGGNFLSSIGGGVAGGGLDNIRGMAVVGSEVWVTNNGSNNDAPGNAVVRIDASTGSINGNFALTGSSWFVLPFNGENLISFSGTSTSRIERYDDSGMLLGEYFAPGQVNFIQQLHESSDGTVLAAVFSNLAAAGNNSAVYEIDTDGSILGTVAGTNNFGPRGVWELGNGNVMWTNGAGIHIADMATGESELILAGSGRYIDLVVVPAPSGAALLVMAGFAGARRRR